MTETTAWQGRYLEIHLVPWNNGGTWEFVTRRNNVQAAVILALTDNQEIILVEQFRPPLGRHCIELPAGLIGDMDATEDPFTSARRELLEETGFTARHWEALGEFASSPGMVGEVFHLFRATGLNRETAGGGVDGENITAHIVSLGQMLEFVEAARARGCAIDTRLTMALGFLPEASAIV